MTLPVVTFDFRDTIAQCDEWFQLEVHRLPSAVFGWAREHGREPDVGLGRAADAAYRRLRLAIHQHGHELPAERSVIAIAELLGVPISVDEAVRGVQVLMRAALGSASAIDGVVETASELSLAGVRLGIVSSAVFHPFLVWTLRRFGIDDRFAVVTTSASAGFYKSRPELFWQTLDRLGGTPAGSAHVGDSLRFDVGGTRRAGMRTAWLNRKELDTDQSGADLILTTMRGAAPRLLALLNGHDR